MKILVVSLAGIGDTLFATPLIHELRANFPNAQIDALVLWAGSRDLLHGNPYLNGIYQRNLIKAGAAASLKFLWQLSRNKYDVSINTHPQSRIHYRLVAWCIDARTRISHRYDNHTPLDRILANRSIDQDYHIHSVENNLNLLGLIDGKPRLAEHYYEIYLSPDDLSYADQFIAANDLKGRTLLGIHVGSGGTKNLALRRWPLHNYVELIRKLANHDRMTILLFGGPEEEKDHREILRECRFNALLVPETKSVRQAAALLKHCHMFLSVDTALMHVAATMKLPKQIVIETPTWNTPIQPYHQSFILVPNPAVAGRNLQYYRYNGKGIRGTDDEIRRCMLSVTVQSVHQAILTALPS
jgi:ADP-heptose:LPS heptosyltransferase